MKCWFCWLRGVITLGFKRHNYLIEEIVNESGITYRNNYDGRYNNILVRKCTLCKHIVIQYTERSFAELKALQKVQQAGK